MCVPRRGLDGVGAAREWVGRVVLHVGFVEDAQARELARLTGAMAGGEHEFRGDDGARATERRLASDVHDDEDDGGMGIPIERAVGNEGWATRVSVGRGNPVAAQQADAGGGWDGHDETCSHSASHEGGTGGRIVTWNESLG